MRPTFSKLWPLPDTCAPASMTCSRLPQYMDPEKSAPAATIRRSPRGFDYKKQAEKHENTHKYQYNSINLCILYLYMFIYICRSVVQKGAFRGVHGHFAMDQRPLVEAYSGYVSLGQSGWHTVAPAGSPPQYLSFRSRKSIFQLVFELNIEPRC